MPRKKTKKVDIKKDTQKESSQSWTCEDPIEGQLSIDVFQKGNNLVVMSTIAGVKSKDVEILIDHDLLTIRGKREKGIEIKEKDYFYKECYWGHFSRSLILPAEVNVDNIKAEMKDGILTVLLPLAEKRKKIEIKTKKGS